MIELKQIQYFVVCAQTGSFSKAAEELFTTQPSVSRVIKSFEDELGGPVFERYAKGIGLTPLGEDVYKHAWAILENIQKMHVTNQEKTIQKIHISVNPSTWFADTFLEYYQLHKDEELHYQIYSLGTHDIVQRIQNRSDDMGFVFVMKKQMQAFQFFLGRNYLEFQELAVTDVMIYPGKKHPYWTDKNHKLRIDKLRLVQRFQDEFSVDNYWDLQDENGFSAADSENIVVTNSDYIMERLLQMSDLANISGAYLSGIEAAWASGVKAVEDENSQVVYGCIKRRGEELTQAAEQFLQFIKNKLR